MAPEIGLFRKMLGDFNGRVGQGRPRLVAGIGGVERAIMARDPNFARTSIPVMTTVQFSASPA